MSFSPVWLVCYRWQAPLERERPLCERYMFSCPFVERPSLRTPAQFQVVLFHVILKSLCQRFYLQILFSESNIRLVNSNDAPTTTLFSSGRLEIYLQGEWGTVCGDGFGFREALVTAVNLDFLLSVYLAVLVILGMIM